MENNENNNFVVEVSPSKLKTLKMLKGDRYFYIHSKYNPQNEAVNYVNNLNIQIDDIIVLVGVGLGYVANEVIKNMSAYNTLVLFETNKSIFNIFKKNFAVNDLINNKIDKVKYILLEDPSEIYYELEKLFNFSLYKKMNFNILPSYCDMWPDYMKKCRYELDKYVGVCSSKLATFEKNNDLWQTNMLKNIPHIYNSYAVGNFYNIFSKKPIIVVSAGPSLDKNVSLLKDIEDKAIIICVYTALRVLYKHNIRPHFVVAVDGMQPLYNDCYNDIPIFYSSILRHEFLKNYEGEKIIFPSDMTVTTNVLFEEYFAQTPLVEVGGSVACSAVDLSVKLGGNPVVVIGQDLSFTGDDSHAKGTYSDESDKDRLSNLDSNLYNWFSHVNKERNKQKDEQIDIYGNKVYTIQSLKTFLYWFENYFETNKNVTKFINATEGGILKKGVEIMDLKQVITNYCKDIIEIDNVIESVFKKGKINDRDKNDALHNILNIKKELEERLVMAKKALQYNEDLKNIYKNDNQDEKQIKTLFTLIDEMDNYFENIVEDVKVLGLRYTEIYSKVNGRINPEDSRELVIIKQNIIFYTGIINAIEEILLNI